MPRGGVRQPVSSSSRGPVPAAPGPCRRDRSAYNPHQSNSFALRSVAKHPTRVVTVESSGLVVRLRRHAPDKAPPGPSGRMPDRGPCRTCRTRRRFRKDHPQPGGHRPLGHGGGAQLSDVRRDHRQPRAQQHPGEPARPRREHGLRPGRADQPDQRGGQPAQVLAAPRVGLHARDRDRGRRGGHVGLALIRQRRHAGRDRDRGADADARRPGPTGPWEA